MSRQKKHLKTRIKKKRKEKRNQVSIKNFKSNKSKPYPFINPIIVSKNYTIIDGTHRFDICIKNNYQVTFITMNYSEDEMLSEDFIHELKTIMDEQSAKLEEWFIKNNKSPISQIVLCSSKDRMKKFFQYQHLFTTDEEYWSQLAYCYNKSNNNYSLITEIKRAFSVKRDKRECLMNKNDISFLNGLPESVTIYRGMSVKEAESSDFGISWSLKKEVAEKFANEYFHNYDTRNQAHIVKELTVKKSDLIAYYSDRDEEEVIYIHQAA